MQTTFCNLRSCLYAVLALCCYGLVTAGNALADWGAQLATGQVITVDPGSRQALVRSGLGRGRPLWDGVHRLADGQTITVRSGVVVPNVAMQRRMPPGPQQFEDQVAQRPAGNSRRRQCNELVLRSCGLRNSCVDAEACNLAVQLRTMQHSPNPRDQGAADWAEQRCREGLQDLQVFATCADAPALESVACEGLKDRVCCAASPSCASARELVELEQRALAEGVQQELEVIRPRCVALLAQQAFFPPCR